MDHHAWRFCVAPMLDWTDRHCRYFHRQFSPTARLYTEMVTTGALMYGDVDRHLRFHHEEHPVALQLGGSDPSHLALCTQLAQQYGYDEVNLNCGCPSPRVQKGAFGACLMLEAQLVADCLKAMQDVADIDVTVKHRIGVDRFDHYDFVRDFVGEIARVGVKVFIVHARSAWLDGLSPKENRDIPPLRYDYVYQLKKDFPDLIFVINGGIKMVAEVQDHLMKVDGVMVGRHAYEYPAFIAEVAQTLFGENVVNFEQVESKMCEYASDWQKEGGYLGAVTKAMLGLYRGRPNARVWRQIMSDHQRLHTLSADTLFAMARAVLIPLSDENAS